jgi:hypothetical protein
MEKCIWVSSILLANYQDKYEKTPRQRIWPLLSSARWVLLSSFPSRAWWVVMPGWGTTAGSEVRASWHSGRPVLSQGKRLRPCLVRFLRPSVSSVRWVWEFRSTFLNERFWNTKRFSCRDGCNNSLVFNLEMSLRGTHNNRKAFSFRCFASNGPGFDLVSTNKRKVGTNNALSLMSSRFGNAGVFYC